MQSQREWLFSPFIVLILIVLFNHNNVPTRYLFPLNPQDYLPRDPLNSFFKSLKIYVNLSSLIISLSRILVSFLISTDMADMSPDISFSESVVMIR